MKKLVYLFGLLLLLTTCGSSSNTENKQQQIKKDKIEVLYFHGKQRCPTCLAIESRTKELLEKSYATKLKSGDIVFKAIDISDAENEAIVNKYEITFSTLLIIKWKDGKEIKKKDVSDMAFQYARNNPESFQSNLKQLLDTF
jgi:hypothetical protein